MDYNPKIIGNRIKEARLHRNLTQQDLADKLNLSESTVSRYESGEVGKIKTPIIETMARVLNVNLMWLLGISDDITVEETPLNAKSIPLIGQIAAGQPILAEENIIDYYAIDKSMNADFALRVKGDSMIDENISDGNIAFIRKQPTLENGEIGAIIIDDEVTLKVFYKFDDRVVLNPANKNHSPIILTDGNVRIAGKLIAVLHEIN